MLARQSKPIETSSPVEVERPLWHANAAIRGLKMRAEGDMGIRFRLLGRLLLRRKVRRGKDDNSEGGGQDGAQVSEHRYHPALRLPSA